MCRRHPRPQGEAVSDICEHEYLGDAVYASNDGYQVWLHLNSHNEPALIALEPAVLLALIKYAQKNIGFDSI